MRSIDNVKVDPEMATHIWHALFVLAFAAEQLGLSDQINGMVNDELKMGAHDYAKMVLAHSSNVSEE